MGKALVLSMLVSILATGLARGATGTVVDPDGRPIAGAEVCLWTPVENTGFCGKTDARGYYRLLDSSAPAVRIVASGYLPETVAAVPQESPVVLRRGAALRVQVVDARDGTPVAEGKIRIVYLSGKELPRFPFNAAGMRLATVEPGSAVITAEAEGYVAADPIPITLVAGRETESVVRLRRAP